MSPEIEILPVYVSSTWLDLGPERRAVEQAVQRLRETKFVGMEYFGSRDEDTRTASLEDIDRSRAYVLLVAGRYGSGITEAEYDRATERGLTRFVYFKDDAAVPDEWRDAEPEQLAKLDAFKRKLRARHLNAPDFKSPDDLAAKVTADLHRWLFDDYLTPKLRGALRGEVTRAEAQALLDAVKDFGELSRDLLAQLQSKGFNVSIGGDYVAGDKIIYNTPAVAVSALHQLPPPPRDFTGRARELGELMSQIEQGGVTISGLQGLGGIGKTALALELGRRLAPRYPDAQFYLDLKGASKQPLSAADALAHVVRAYHPTAKLPEGEAELQALYLSVLHGKRALLLMDNAAGREQVEPLVPPEGSVLLITSRQHFHVPGLFALDLEALPPEDARQLLLKIAPRIGERADEMAKLCGYLPLALRLAAGALAERVSLSPADYVRRLSDAKKRLELVEASLTLSYELLSPEQQRLWCSLSVFPDTFDAAAATAVWELDADAAQDALGDLVRYSLLEWNTDISRFGQHDLARLFADTRLRDDERRATRLRHAARYLTVLQECDALYMKGGDAIKTGIALFDVERRNIEAGQAWACRQSSGEEAAARLCNKYPNAGAYVLNLRQRPRESISWLEAALAAARQLKARAFEGVHLGNLGLAYVALGEMRRAVEAYEQQLAINREMGDRYNEAAGLSNLGVAYKNLGETRRAVEFYEQALALSREIGDRLGEGNALGNLGNAYDILGETRRAVEFHEQYLSITRERGDPRGEATALGNLGNAYATLGETRRAVELYKQQLIIARELGDRGNEGNALFNTGLALDTLGERTKAIAHVEAAVKIYELIESPNTERARAQLAQWRG